MRELGTPGRYWMPRSLVERQFPLHLGAIFTNYQNKCMMIQYHEKIIALIDWLDKNGLSKYAGEIKNPEIRAEPSREGATYSLIADVDGRRETLGYIYTVRADSIEGLPDNLMQLHFTGYQNLSFGAIRFMINHINDLVIAAVRGSGGVAITGPLAENASYVSEKAHSFISNLDIPGLEKTKFIVSSYTPDDYVEETINKSHAMEELPNISSEANLELVSEKNPEVARKLDERYDLESGYLVLSIITLLNISGEISSEIPMNDLPEFETCPFCGEEKSYQHDEDVESLESWVNYFDIDIQDFKDELEYGGGPTFEYVQSSTTDEDLEYFLEMVYKYFDHIA
jgi:hypothetical protein